MQAYCKTCERMIDTEGAKTIRTHGNSSLIIASDGLAHTITSGPKVKSSKRSPKSAEQIMEEQDVN